MKKTRTAKTYIYRNLHEGCFSLRVRGKVIEHFTDPRVISGGFQVSAAGRAKVLKEKKKYVHAYVTTYHGMQPFLESDWTSFKKREVIYNPYKNEAFVYADTGEKCYAALIVMDYPKVYALTSKES